MEHTLTYSHTITRTFAVHCTCGWLWTAGTSPAAIRKGDAHLAENTTTFEKLTDTTYVSADWRYAIEYDDGEWLLKEGGNIKRAFAKLDEAIAWAIAWDKGEAR